MNTPLIISPIADADWDYIMSQPQLRNLIGIPVFYNVRNGAFRVWPTPENAYYPEVK